MTNLELVPVFADEQEHVIKIDTKQILSASLLKQIDQGYIPLRKFIQQPTPTLGSFDTVDSTKMLIPRISDQQDGNYKGTPIPAVPLSWSPPQQSQPMNKEIVVRQGGVEAEKARITSQLSYIERKENWIIRCLPRSKPNRWDKYYVHLKTDVQFRSLIDVHTFIIHGILPERRKGKLIKEDDADNNDMVKNPQPRKVRGDKLLNRVPVGYFNLTRHEIFRNEISHSNIGNKRKREDEASSQVNQQDLLYTLYDFEPIVN